MAARAAALLALAVLALAACVLAPAVPARASCLDGRWPLEREATALAAAAATGLESGAHVQILPFQTFTLRLDKLPEIATAPGQPLARADGHEGYLLFRLEAPGLYQITLPEAARVDILQRGQFLQAAAFTQAKDCPGVRKSVRFDLKPGAGLLRITRAEGPRISFVVSEVEHIPE